MFVHLKFSVNEEEKGRLSKMIDDLAEWGHPIGKIETNLMVKNALDKNKVIEKRYENNIPGNAWVNGFSKKMTCPKNQLLT